MNPTEFGSRADYHRAFKALAEEGLPSKHLALLRLHHAAPNHTTTWKRLAAAVGYHRGSDVNLQYGRLAHRVADQLGIRKKPRGFWLFVLVDWADECDPESGHTAFVLRAPVIQALAKLGLVDDSRPVCLPDELPTDQTLKEGGRLQVLVNAHERNPEARRRCLQAHGTRCAACGLSFGATYGPDCEGFIHVHHLRPLSGKKRPSRVDPVRDLRPVCPNCHAVIHLSSPCLTIEQVRGRLRQRGERASRT